MKCPECGHEFGVIKGGLSLPDLGLRKTTEEEETPKKPVRGKARDYTEQFEIAWKAYGRKEQKFEAFGVWLLRAKEIGSETRLLSLVIGALKWQASGWAAEGWKFAPYFERYLKRRKWEDERPPAPVASPRAVDDRAVRATDAQVEKYRAAAARAATADELVALRGGSRG